MASATRPHWSCRISSAAILLKTMLPEGWHFYNRVGGRRLDFTASQFTNLPHYEDLAATREEIMAGTSDAQCEALKARLGRPLPG